MDNNKFLVVVAVLEGRGFPKRPKHQMIIEARFDGELLATDPVEHVETPDITQELAWELDRKALHQHRLQRSSIKVQCYAYDAQSTMKETVGYVVLDLRSAQAKQMSKWYQLLNSKYHKTRPEIRLGLYLDDDKTSEEQNSFKAREAPPRIVEEIPSVPAGYDMKTMKPVLNEAEGYYQLGPEQRCSEQFVLSITIAYAANLTQLIPSSVTLPPRGAGYFFYYSMLGNDVTNEAFQDLIGATFPAERASVRIRSSVEALHMFFANQPGIQVHLCCGEQSLGSSEIPLKSLLRKGSTEIYMKPVMIEGAFQLIPPNRLNEQLPLIASNLTPVVGVSICLRKEEMLMTSSPARDSPAKVTKSFHPTSPPKAQQTLIKESPQQAHREAPATKPSKSDTKAGLNKELVAKAEVEKVSDSKGKTAKDATAEAPAGEKGDYSESFESYSVETTESINKNAQSSKAEARTEKSSDVDKAVTVQFEAGSAASTPAHHFTFSTDLKSISNLDTPVTANVFLRYTYPFFGSAAPILTHPPVEIRRGMEVLMPQSFCAFDFACSGQQLQETFLRIPLLVELWNRDHQLSKDVLLGVATLPLSQVLTAEKTRVMHPSDGDSGWRLVYTDRQSVISTDGSQRKVGEVTFTLSLEDWGVMTPGQPAVQQQLGPVSPDKISHADQTEQAVQEPRSTSEYQTAMELELWKEAQEQMFENQLKQKEMAYMQALAEEWTKRDKERELLVHKKMVEYTMLEEKLKKTLSDLEKREKQLAANEQEVLRLRGDLQREHESKLQETHEASRRLKDDCDHQVQLQKTKVNELEELISRYKQEVVDAGRKYQTLDKEFIAYKEQQSSRPEVQLQSEINILTLEKVELDRKLDSVTKSKVHYKQQWGKALKELARLKQKEQEAARAHLKRQQQELEHMRLRYLAAEEKEVMKDEKKELEDIKNELNRMKLLEEEKQHLSEQAVQYQTNPAVINTNSTAASQSQNTANLDTTIESHITRLIEERDTLLRTGVYTHQDAIIAELDKQIKEAISLKTTS